MENDDDVLRGRLDAVNRARLGLADEGAAFEAELEAAFGAASRLAVYGTLAPGKANHHHVADLGGAWQPAAVRGRLGHVPAGEHKGLPAIVLHPALPPHPLHLLMCDQLPAHWARLDAFEGPEMQRLLVPLEADGRITGVANIYALRGAMLERLG